MRSGARYGYGFISTRPDHAEYGYRGADPQRERNNGGKREARIMNQLAQRVAKVLKQRVHDRSRIQGRLNECSGPHTH